MQQHFNALINCLLDAELFLGQAVEILEKGMIEAVLDRRGGNQSLAAKDLGIHRNTLQRKMEVYKINGRRPKRRPVTRARAKAATRVFAASAS